jgi:hypothetical protein
MLDAGYLGAMTDMAAANSIREKQKLDDVMWAREYTRPQTDAAIVERYVYREWLRKLDYVEYEQAMCDYHGDTGNRWDTLCRMDPGCDEWLDKEYERITNQTQMDQHQEEWHSDEEQPNTKKQKVLPPVVMQRAPVAPQKVLPPTVVQRAPAAPRVSQKDEEKRTRLEIAAKLKADFQAKARADEQKRARVEAAAQRHADYQAQMRAAQPDAAYEAKLRANAEAYAIERRKTHRQCKECGKHEINKKKDANFTTCWKCHQKRQAKIAELPKRMCNQCGLYVIPIDAENSGWEQCVTCRKQIRDHADKLGLY